MANISLSWYFWHFYFAWSNLGSNIPACMELYVQWEILLCFPTISFANFLVELKMEVAQSCPTLCDPHGLPGPWNSPSQNYWSIDPNLGIKPRSPGLQADSLPAEPQVKPKNTGVGSLFLLQRIFLTQESNWSPLHWRFFTSWATREAIICKISSKSIKSIVQFSSVAQSCPTLCDPMDCSMPGLPVHYQLLEFTQR